MLAFLMLGVFIGNVIPSRFIRDLGRMAIAEDTSKHDDLNFVIDLDQMKLNIDHVLCVLNFNDIDIISTDNLDVTFSGYMLSRFLSHIVYDDSSFDFVANQLNIKVYPYSDVSLGSLYEALNNNDSLIDVTVFKENGEYAVFASFRPSVLLIEGGA